MKVAWVLAASAAWLGCGDDQTGGQSDTGDDTAPLFDTTFETEVATETVETVEFDTAIDTGVPDSAAETTNDTTSLPDTAGETVGAGEFSAPCVGNTDCLSGYCVEGPTGYVCTRLCESTCPAGWDCKGVTGETDVVFLCMPRTDKLCAPCLDDLQCNGGPCIAIDGERRCARDCTGDADCPSDFACVAGDGGKHCVPATGSCSCYGEVDGGLRGCRNENAAGTCFGLSACDPASGWGACDAATPVTETCNGKDDDCDAFVDEDIAAVGGACEVTVGGVGSCDGTTICAGVAGLQCQGPTPTPETCDFEDDDCDGAVDEDFKTGAVYATFDHCGSCNRSCAIGFPNAAQTTCQVQQGVAQCVVVSCQPGFIKQNDFQCIPDIVNLCEPCSDDSNCLGQGSACVSLEDGDFCAKACTGNECPVGFSCEVVPGRADKQCLPTTGVCSCGPATLGLSRACSVTVSPSGQPSTTCAGTETCGAAGWGACALPGESCNGFDDDCDGTVDDGFRNASGEYDQVDNCGACGISCLALSIQNADPICDASGAGAPQCSFRCQAGWVDVDEVPGCECHPTSTTDLPDPDGIDANCDGIDGELDQAIFVARTGDDGGLGTIDDPLRTVQAGITKAAQLGKREVLVATGVYVESLTLVDRVDVYGGYSPDFGERDRFTHEAAILGVDPTEVKRGAVNASAIAKTSGDAVIFDGFSIFGADNFADGGNSYAVYLRDIGAFFTLTNNTIIAGNGGAGSTGLKGNDGARGVDGDAGEGALWTPSAGVCNEDHTAEGGDPGERTCGNTDVSGGKGGTRICPDAPANVRTDPQVSEAREYGLPGHYGAGDGGDGGEPGWDEYVTQGACSPVSSPNAHDSFGANGGPGEPGSDGLAASACVASAGTVDGSGHWSGPHAGDGGSAGHGRGGGGGGAAGGVDVGACAYRVVVGGSGGGGGSGGCGGTRGQAGNSGGGSFAIFLAYSSAPAGLPTIADNTIVRGRGGTGGAGGTGGVGGSEGLGGQGGSSRRGEEPGQSYPFNCCASGGGDGGPGGPGGHGGGGGGGCGGPAYGLYIAPVALGLSRASIYDNELPQSGVGGAPGAGGFSLGKPGPVGGAGLNAATNF